MIAISILILAFFALLATKRVRKLEARAARLEEHVGTLMVMADHGVKPFRGRQRG